MAAINSEQVTPSQGNESSCEIFAPRNTRDQPCDVVLVVEDGKEFKAHRKVLSEASPYFEKLLKSDMRESKEGIIRLEMFNECVMAATLEFLYTGHVQISTEDNARDLIVMADYLFLQKIKSLAEGILAQKLNTSNCISTFYFSERYQCEELLSKTKKFILANFSAVYANWEDVLNMSSKEVEMWISSDEMDVSAEEDVFKFILAWIDHDKSKRRKYFAELFRNVRLVYVSRDFLISDVVTNDLVKDNEGCLDLVKDAIDSIDSKNCDYLSVPARKSLETPAIVIRRGAELLCYFPDEDSWCRLGQIPKDKSDNTFQFFPCGGKLYGVRAGQYSPDMDMVRFNTYANSWTRLPPFEEDKRLLQIFVTNEEEMYALLSDRCSCLNVGGCDKEHSWFISKYKPESHSWEKILLLDNFDPNVRQRFCTVASGHFIYFISGAEVTAWFSGDLSNVDRYDVSKSKWEKVAHIQVAREWAQGAAVNGQIFIAGGYQENWSQHVWWPDQCELYDETTNKWQFIASLKKPTALVDLVAADGKMYAVSSPSIQHPDLQQITIECYNPEKNMWEMKSEAVFPGISQCLTALNACSMRIFKGLCHICILETSTCTSDSFSGILTTAQGSHSHICKRKCVVM